MDCDALRRNARKADKMGICLTLGLHGLRRCSISTACTVGARWVHGDRVHVWSRSRAQGAVYERKAVQGVQAVQNAQDKDFLQSGVPFHAVRQPSKATR